jgi:hypothetical protein
MDKTSMIARVFPTRTHFTPNDEHAYFDVPGLFTPQYDEVHISTVFTWDIPQSQYLANQWKHYGRVIIGGPALNDPGNEFVPGKYMKRGCTFTSRGCPNTCWYCVVPKREGKIRELPIADGNIIMDNNLLACSEKHLSEVFKMLSDKKRVEFNQGLEAKLITQDIADEIRKLNIYRVWFAYDRAGDLQHIVSAFKKLAIPGRKISVYLLAGYQNDTPTKAESRCMEIAKLGCYPFMMLYQPENKIKYPKEWRLLQKKWTRPAAWKSFIKNNHH